MGLFGSSKNEDDDPDTRYLTPHERKQWKRAQRLIDKAHADPFFLVKWPPRKLADYDEALMLQVELQKRNEQRRPS